MKKIFKFLLLIVWPFASFSQFAEEWRYDLSKDLIFSGYSGMVDLRPTHSGVLTCIWEYNPNANWYNNHYSEINSNGAAKWKVTDSLAPITSLDNSTNEIVLTTQYKSLIVKRDHNGNYKSTSKIYWDADSTMGGGCSQDAVVSHSKIYTLCSSYLFSYSLFGNFNWKKNTGSANRCIKVSQGNIYILRGDDHLLKYDSAGNQLFNLAVGAISTNLITDTSGNCYVIGQVLQGQNFVQKISSVGSVLWTQYFPEGNFRVGTVYGDSVYLAGNVPLVKANQQGSISGIRVISALNGNKGTFFTHDLKLDKNEWIANILVLQSEIYVLARTGEYQYPHLLKFRNVGLTTEVNLQKDQKNAITIFPNPSGSRFTIACDKPGVNSIKVKVHNSAGQLIYNKEMPYNEGKNWEIDLGKQPTGTYNVEILAGEKRTVKKVVVE